MTTSNTAPSSAGSQSAPSHSGMVSAVQIAQALGRPEPTGEQVAAIEAPLEPLLIIAGAGSGKTETMAARVVWLVANQLIAAEEVLGLTFTRKAASELSQRIRARLRQLHRRGLIDEPGLPSVSTYNSYASSIVSDHGVRIGVEPGSRLLGEAASWQLADEIVGRWDGTMDAVSSARGTVTDAVLALSGACAEHLVDPAELATSVEATAEFILSLRVNAEDAEPAWKAGKLTTGLMGIVQKLQARGQLVPLIQAYREAKREREAIDFSDQVSLAAQIAQGFPEVGAGERASYGVVLLDEYQDTSTGQLTFLRGLFSGGHPVTAVGDPHQSIYGWRGASAGNLQRFVHEFPRSVGGADGSAQPATITTLSTTWRNDSAILQVANHVASPLRERPHWVRESDHLDVPALQVRPGAGAGDVQAHWCASSVEEAELIADLAQQYWKPSPRGSKDEGASLAVLCRTRSQFPDIEQALRARGLPVEVVGLGGLLQVPEVADLRAALDVIQDPGRGDALMRLITGSAWRIGPADLDALGAWSRELLEASGLSRRKRDDMVSLDAVDESSIVDAIEQLPPEGWSGRHGQAFSVAGRQRLQLLADSLRRLRTSMGLPLVELIAEVEHELRLDIEVAAWPGRNAGTARSHLDAFAQLAATFVSVSERTGLGAFLAWLAATEKKEHGLDLGTVEQQDDAIQILTVHAAKGLEWDTCIVPGLVEKKFPSKVANAKPTATGWPEQLDALPHELRGDAAGLPVFGWQGAVTTKELSSRLKDFKSDCGMHAMFEERRLAYVAFTRARQRLIVSGSSWSQNQKPHQPSVFFEEVAQLFPPAEVVVLPSAEDENPVLAASQVHQWPIDPLGEHRPQVEHAAQMVMAALEDPLLLLDGVGQMARDGAAGGAVGDASGGSPESGPEGAVAALSPWSEEIDVLLAERDRASSGTRQVALPGHLSASHLVTMASDPDSLAGMLRRPMPQKPSVASRRGSAFHAWLEERFASPALLDLDDLPAADATVLDPDLQRLKDNFLASPWAQRSPHAVEVPIETPIGSVMVRGRIDAVFRTEDGQWQVVDWKTGRAPSAADAVHRNVQLAVYRLAWARLQEVPVEQVSAAFFYASTGQTIEPDEVADEAGLVALVQGALAG